MNLALFAFFIVVAIAVVCRVFVIREIILGVKLVVFSFQRDLCSSRRMLQSVFLVLRLGSRCLSLNLSLVLIVPCRWLIRDVWLRQRRQVDDAVGQGVCSPEGDDDAGFLLLLPSMFDVIGVVRGGIIVINGNVATRIGEKRTGVPCLFHILILSLD